MKQNGKALLSVIKHPLFLLVIGALVSSYIIPLYTSLWQDHQKELELKTDLLRKISESTSDVITVTWLLFNPVEGGALTQKDYDLTYRNWIVSSSIIDSEIRAYYENTSISDEWKNYSVVLSNFLNLVSNSNLCKRFVNINNIHTFLFQDNLIIKNPDIKSCKIDYGYDNIQRSKLLTTNSSSNIDWDNFLTPQDISRYLESITFIKQKLLEQKDKIIEQTLKLNIPDIYRKM